MFLNDLVRYCRTDSGYTTLESVLTKEKGDRTHSFFLAETLKYLIAVLAGIARVRPRGFNTEAHPLRRTW